MLPCLDKLAKMSKSRLNAFLKCIRIQAIFGGAERELQLDSSGHVCIPFTLRHSIVTIVIPPDALQRLSALLRLIYLAIFDRSHVKLHGADLAGQEVRQSSSRENFKGSEWYITSNRQKMRKTIQLHNLPTCSRNTEIKKKNN